ncbi:MAG: MFS transporter [Candidatus Lokiarchaeota archaeon]|nr:MFS transporter [Candidatus Lokiarchaeota archaeon]
MSNNAIENAKFLSDESSGIVPIKEKLAYSFAQMPGTFYGGVMGVIQSFYFAWMGLLNIWITIAQIVYAVWNVVNDPIFGNVIGNTRYYNKKRGEVQRYMPYIKFGAPLFSLFFALVFFPPDAWRGQTSNLTIQVWLFIWYLVSQIAYDTLFTLVLCAVVALLPQMTLNQREREKIQLYSTAATIPAILFGFIVPVIYLADPSTETIAQFQLLVVIIAIFGIFPYLILSKYVREHSEYIPKNETPLFKSIKLAFKNPSFRVYVIYDGISVFLLNIIMVSLPFYLTWVLTPMEGFNMLLFWIGPIICVVISVPIVLKIAAKKSTKASITYYLSMLTIGGIFSFIAGISGNWILVSIGFSITMLGLTGDFIQHNPMRADTIDYDYWKISGERREGLYAGVGSLLSKPMISVALAVPPAVFTAFGLIYVDAIGGLDATQSLQLASLGVNIIMTLLPVIASLIGLIVWIKFYPLTGEIVEKMKKDVSILHEQRRKEYKESRSSKNISS